MMSTIDADDDNDVDDDDDADDDDDDDDDDDPSSPFLNPLPPQASLSHEVWSYRVYEHIYIHIYVHQ